MLGVEGWRCAWAGVQDRSNVKWGAGSWGRFVDRKLWRNLYCHVRSMSACQSLFPGAGDTKVCAWRSRRLLQRAVVHDEAAYGRHIAVVMMCRAHSADPEAEQRQGKYKSTTDCYVFYHGGHGYFRFYHVPHGT